MKGRKPHPAPRHSRDEPSPYPLISLAPHSDLRSEAVNDLMQEVFHYRYNSALSLESARGSGFTFETESHYDALGNYVSAFVFCVMKEVCNLREVWLPPHHPQFCVFQSQDWGTNTSKALIIIPGKSEIGLGIWSRKICINEGLAAGSMLSYVTRAQSEGYSVLIMNCNAHTSTLPTNESNAEATWKSCLPQCKAASVYIVAHSWGGKCTLHLLKTCFNDVSRRVVGIAFTDSVHKTVADLPRLASEFLKNKAVNWIKSQRPVDTLLSDKLRSKDGCENRSAGTDIHEYTSSSAIDCVFTYLSLCVRRTTVRPGLRPR